MQKIIKGVGELSQLKEIIKASGVKRIFLVTGKKSYIDSSVRDTFEPLFGDLILTRFSKFEENPKIEDVKAGIDLFVKNKCELIISAGGGSVIDMGKLIKAFCFDIENIELLIESNKVGKNLDKIQLIVIPTTSGSGSEATHFAVVYKNKLKYSVADFNLLPSVVFLDPKFTYSTSPYLTAITGIDAFSQAMESWWSVNSTEESISYSKKALKIIWESLPVALQRKSYEAKDKLMEASYFAGKAINITKTTGPHALSYGFTTYCKVPHGNAVAIFLPNFIQVNRRVTQENCNDSRGKEWVINVMKDISKELGTSIECLAEDVVKFIHRCGLRIDFYSLGITQKKFENAIKGINQDRLKNNPVNLNEATIRNFYISKFNNE